MQEPESREEILNRIRERLEQLSVILKDEYDSRKRVCPRICELLSLSPDLQNEFSSYWNICGCRSGSYEE